MSNLRGQLSELRSFFEIDDSKTERAYSALVSKERASMIMCQQAEPERAHKT
jgi:hypothetical protein